MFYGIAWVHSGYGWARPTVRYGYGWVHSPTDIAHSHIELESLSMTLSHADQQPQDARVKHSLCSIRAFCPAK